jgi:hypothetical protein
MKKTLLVLAVLAVLVFLQRVGHHMEIAGSTGHKVLYVISGDPNYTNGRGEPCITASLTYINSSGGTQQEPVPSGCSSPYEMEVTKASGDPVYISAQLTYESEHEIHVSILVDGKLLQKADSSGQYSIATASGSVP